MTTWHTADETAEHFKISKATVTQRARDGRWPSARFGPRQLRFSDEHWDKIQALVEFVPAKLSPTEARARRDATKALLRRVS